MIPILNIVTQRSHPPSSKDDREPKIWERHGLKPWLEAARKRLHHNVLAIAFADKLARIAWSVLARGRAFEVRKINQAAPQAT